jgi:predicted O-methyltransferase YrrM
MMLLRRLKQNVTLIRMSVSPVGDETVHMFSLMEAVRHAGLPFRDLRDIVSEISVPGSVEKVAMHPFLRGGGSGSTGEMAALAAITAAMRPKTILEFGTFDGASTWHLLANAHEACTLTTIDLPSGTVVDGSSDLDLQGKAGRRTFLPADHRVRLLEVDSRHWIPDISGVDLCFIDAGHTYECVKNDTEKVMPLMRSGGLILWHDAAWRRDGYGVNRYLTELRAKGSDVCVVRLGPYEYCALAFLVVTTVASSIAHSPGAPQ